MFIPTTKKELKKQGWDRADIILVTGDAYIDSPFVGVSIIGKVLIKAGYRVGIIAQPDINSDKDISRLGEPLLFWGITGGCIDSMVANYTASKKRRKSDDYTPGGLNTKRPDRAVIAYTNLVKRHFKKTRPVVLGGVEASLRRIIHYDYWSNSVRRSILFDSKADIIAYGMAEKAIINIADNLKDNKPLTDIRGICYISKTKEEKWCELPSYETVSSSKEKFMEMFKTFYISQNHHHHKVLCQKHGDRYLVHNPPSPDMTTEELDNIYALDFERAAHPSYKKEGKVKAIETIKSSITTHRGCSGECSFCSISLHQGRKIISRSETSILKEAHSIARDKNFKGNIHDVGGPTANMYGMKCGKTHDNSLCSERSCIYPNICRHLVMDHHKQMKLLKKIQAIPSVKKVFIASGLRHDMIMADKKKGLSYINQLARHHVSGQLKLAPEHTDEKILKLMRKPDFSSLLAFKEHFDECSFRAGKKQFLTYYFIAAHPGCKAEDMKKMKSTVSKELKLHPEQVQIFIPLPSTFSAVMYHTGVDPFSGKPVFTEKDIKNKEKQKDILTKKRNGRIWNGRIWNPPLR